MTRFGGVVHHISHMQKFGHYGVVNISSVKTFDTKLDLTF